ncbi:hypothetical protein M3P05_16475 [Sansalvadorimonas sp. 2012CJ34-2]|uniref:Uncharacterized protein n=1 Tax=Parendozoicomonas callyspongiae TaxID=2942213 RepID=A0ABT0PJJ1_9GAMM|nr:hypothetical protein [Sansalvadorimonas sp. 2012CJ34-2]MCL6271514.1 hypothetical protein [Sansalvadorimonas sp. 2012CJ34-2]
MASLQVSTMILSENQKKADLPLQQRINNKQKERMEQFNHSVEKPAGQIFAKTLTGDTHTINFTNRGPVAEIIMGLLQKKACHLYSARVIYMGKRISFGDILSKRHGTGDTNFAKEGPIHLVHTDDADNLHRKFCEFLISKVKDPDTGEVEPMMPESINTPEKIEDLLVRIFDQMRGGEASVYAHEFIELQSHLEEARIYADMAQMPDEDKSRLKDYIDTLLRCLSIYKLPFVGHQKAFLDDHIKKFQSYRSEGHQQMTTDELLDRLDQATVHKDPAEAYSCLDVLIQGIKFNLLTVEQLAQVMVNPHLPRDAKEALRPLAALHASQTTGIHSLRTHTAIHRSRLESTDVAPPMSLPQPGYNYRQK